MGVQVKVRQVMTTVDTEAGTEMWLPDSESLRGMVAGGYWEVLEERGTASPKARKAEQDGGTDTP